MLIPSDFSHGCRVYSSLSRRVNANSQPYTRNNADIAKLIKKGEC